MPKILYFLHVMCLLFALQATAAEPAVNATLLDTSVSTTALSAAIDDSLSADFGQLQGSVDMLEIAEVDVDKILLPGFSYPLQKTTYRTPEHHLSLYRLQFGFLLDRPPQSV